MNIFFLHEEPWEAARMMCDKHVVKMVLETAQLLSTAHRVADGDPLPDERELVFYKKTHVNHPCAKWCRESVDNYWWLADHFHGLLVEYKFRYGREHKCSSMLYQLQSPPLNVKKFVGEVDFSVIVPCVADDCVIDEDVVGSYRKYYNTHKRHLLKYKNREVPDWIIQN
jgi:hypothetical protein